MKRADNKGKRGVGKINSVKVRKGEEKCRLQKSYLRKMKKKQKPLLLIILLLFNPTAFILILYSYIAYFRKNVPLRKM